MGASLNRRYPGFRGPPTPLDAKKPPARHTSRHLTTRSSRASPGRNGRGLRAGPGPSGRTRALKIVAQNAAEEAYKGGNQTLSRWNRTPCRGVIDLTKDGEGRLTLVMERVGGETLRQWLATHPTPEATAPAQLAEDLLAGLTTWNSNRSPQGF